MNVPTAHTLDASGSLLGRSGLREVYDAVGVADRGEDGVYCGPG